MFPQRVAEHLDRVWMVAQWKWELDPGTSWYQRAFFKYVFRPFLHFSWNVMKIPTPKGVKEIDGKTQTFFWFENGGFFSSEDQADLACVGTYDGYKDVPLDRAFPPESAQYSSLVFPRQKNPRQHRRSPSFHLIVAPRDELAQLKEEVAKLRSELRQAHR